MDTGECGGNTKRVAAPPVCAGVVTMAFHTDPAQATGWKTGMVDTLLCTEPPIKPFGDTGCKKKTASWLPACCWIRIPGGGDEEALGVKKGASCDTTGGGFRLPFIYIIPQFPSLLRWGIPLDLHHPRTFKEMLLDGEC